MDKIKLYVIIPDIASGDYFNEKLKKYHIETSYGYYKIRPRVIQNKLTRSVGVARDMDKIFATFKDKTRSVVIACNTLQLWLDDVKPIYKKNVKIYTTFEACEWKYRELKDKPIWLGTTPLVRRVKKFPTLLDYKASKTQYKTQELIWRIKMLWGDDISTAFDSVKADQIKDKSFQQKIINKLKQEIINDLKKLGIKKVISGCTELPMIFDKEEDSGIVFIDPAEVLAEYIKAQSVVVLFAGGTISSMTRKDGVLVGGKVFNLIERVLENIPGSMNHLNITKSKILYFGLSENLTFSDQEIFWKEIKKTLKSRPKRIVITHGTDSIEQTARYLEEKIKKTKNITTELVLTASDDSPLNQQTDALDNLRYAITQNIPKKYEQRVLIAFHQKLIPANEVVKSYYDGNKMFYLSKKSQQWMKMKNRYEVKVSGLIANLEKKFLNSAKDNDSVMTYEVNVIRKSHKEFLTKFKNNPSKVVLFKLYHSGTANTFDSKLSVARLVKELRDKGVVSFGATENGEPVTLKAYETSVSLLQAGMVPTYNMLFEVALAKLKLLKIGENDLSQRGIIKKMLTNVSGEIDESLINKFDVKKLKQLYNG